MTTNSITTKARIVALSAVVKHAWGLIRLGGRWSDKIEHARLYAKPAWRLCRRIEAMGWALEAWPDRTAQRLGVLDDVLDRAACAG